MRPPSEESSTAPPPSWERRVVLAFALVNLPLVLWNGTGYLGSLVRPASIGLTAFVALSFVLHFVCLWGVPTGVTLAATRGRRAAWIGAGLAVSSFWVLHGFMLLDARIFESFRFHLNGFVLEVLLQDEAIRVLGIQAGEVGALLALLLGVGVAEGVGYALLRRFLLRRRADRPSAAPRPRTALLIGLGFVLMVVGERLGFAWLHYTGRTEAVAQARVFPFYIPVSMRHALRRVAPQDELSPPRAEAGHYLAYPKAPVHIRGGERRLNVVWIVVEAWRADFLTAEDMPNTHAFAQECVTFGRHLSGGNATRLGLFSMFYGLHPAKFPYFRDAKRGPVFFDALLDMDYRIKILSSASLKFLGPHETIFARVQGEIEESFSARPATSDRLMTDRFLAWLKGRRGNEDPFFSFLFFDGSHPRCDFEDGFAKYRPYLEDLRDIDKHPERKELLVNRYKNSLVNIDHHVGRVLDELKREGLLDRTIVLITGDHGAEFWEHGHFTHSSAFTEEQLSVPLLLRAPGVAPRRIERLTSHLDLPATVFELLHVEADPAAYSQGGSLLGIDPRPFAVASGWTDHAYIDDEVKIVFHQANAGVSLWEVTGRDDESVEDPRAILRTKSPQVARCLRLFPEFLRGDPGE